MGRKKKKNKVFTSKPIYNRSSTGYICFCGRRIVNDKKTGKERYVCGYWFKFWGSKSWRFISLKNIVFLAHNYIEGQDMGDIG